MEYTEFLEKLEESYSLMRQFHLVSPLLKPALKKQHKNLCSILAAEPNKSIYLERNIADPNCRIG